MPGTPLTLSMVSPISASTSTTCSGRDAELVLHAGGVVPRAFFARIEHADAVAHQLKEILVAGDDRDVVAFGRGPLRHRADHIVGFVALVR